MQTLAGNLELNLINLIVIVGLDFGRIVWSAYDQLMALICRVRFKCVFL